MSTNNDSRRDGDKGRQERRPRTEKPYRGDSRDGGRPYRSGGNGGNGYRGSSAEGGRERSYSTRSSEGGSYGDRPRRQFRNNANDDRQQQSANGNEQGNYRPRRTFHKEGDSDRPRRAYRSNEEGQSRAYRSNNNEGRGERPRRSFGSEGEGRPRRRFDGDRPNGKSRQQKGAKPFNKKTKTPPPEERIHEDGSMRLNKYIAHAGICSRREADNLIAAGSVSINGKVVTEMGYKVLPTDVVSYGGETLRAEAKRYFLLNKPKGFITTLDDPQERQTVMMLIDGACKERIYPVGRLDRNTTGLLLFTNDGEMAKKLTHPSTGVYKIYQVELNKAVTREDMRRMLEGIELEDGPIHVDDVQYVTAADDKRIVGVELHSGKNRIVRRIFEHLGYDVHKLDRVVFAGLTKKDLPRGRYRELTPKEVGFLKMI